MFRNMPPDIPVLYFVPSLLNLQPPTRPRDGRRRAVRFFGRVVILDDSFPSRYFQLCFKERGNADEAEGTAIVVLNRWFLDMINRQRVC